MAAVFVDIADDRSKIHAGIESCRSAIIARAAIDLSQKWPGVPAQSVFNICSTGVDATVRGLGFEVSAWFGAEQFEKHLAETLANSDNQSAIATLIVDEAVRARKSIEIEEARKKQFIETEPGLNRF